ncbi:hypothetical protein [Shewanella mangrovisoli]|uniref:hypothetical protein n=1 Tax=Shewanella mangrovisoli TaxID=2864211 RepID=UPI001C6559A8|nr:hypothetical protein [Shewanella mangrovisoli]QYK08374.1 hypothetical protein K0H60_16400 [Shewanella mangrovisoli]
MRVVDTENRAWFLFEHEGEFYLDANCSMSAFGYHYLIPLNEQESVRYRDMGRAYLKQLAYDIHDSVPIAENSRSIYRGRDQSREFEPLTRRAILLWRERLPPTT